MNWGGRGSAVVCLAVLIALAGCGQLLNPGTQSEETVTPAPVPDQPAVTDTGATTATADAVRETPSNTSERYRSIRPTCTRPPSLVIHVQVSALANNDPATNEGINTTWQFAAPSNRRSIGSFVRFVDVIERGYGPLLDAETVTFGPIERGNGTATRQVAVRKGNRTTAYRWKLELQPDGPLEGCWLTTSVVGIDEDGVVSLPPVDGLPRP